MVTYSHSRLSSFEQCPLKFKFRYIDKLTPDIKQTIEGFLGNRVHDALELIYIEAQKGKIFELDEILQFYLEKWNKEYSKDIKIVKEEFQKEYYMNLGLKFIADYFLANHPFKDNTIATEKKISVKLDSSEKYLIEGYIDRLVHNKETNIFEIHDYKTGMFMKSQEELDKDRQLALYSLGIKNSFPNVKEIKLIWHYLAFNKTMISKRSDEELYKLRDNIISLINKIESTYEFNPSPSCLCKWCEFRSYCPIIKSESPETYCKEVQQTLPDFK